MVSVIIVNFNGKEFLKDCLDSVLRQSYADFEVIMVDNASSDGSYEFVCENFKDSRIKSIKTDTNLWFAGGNNFGLKYARGEHIVLLNNDTVVDKDWLKNLIEIHTGKPDIGITQSLVITEGVPVKYYKVNGTVNLLGHNIMEVFKIGEDGTGEIFQANGCSMMISKKLIEEFGGLFPEEYYAYAEDTYICLKAKFAGYKIMHTSKSVVRHKGNATMKKLNNRRILFLQERNRLLNFILFFGKGFRVKYIFFLIINFVIKFAAALFRGRYSVKSLTNAYMWILKNGDWIKTERESIARIKKENDGDVLKYLSGRIFNGDNIFEKVINYISLSYCRIVRIKVWELSK